MHEVLPTAQRLTFLSSPPVTRTRPDLAPRDRQLTLAPWAVYSSAIQEKKYSYYYDLAKCEKRNELTQLPSSLASCGHDAGFIVFLWRCQLTDTSETAVEKVATAQTHTHSSLVSFVLSISHHLICGYRGGRSAEVATTLHSLFQGGESTKKLECLYQSPHGDDRTWTWKKNKLRHFSRYNHYLEFQLKIW